MVNPVPTPRVSADFLAIAHQAIQEASKLAADRGSKPELVQHIFDRFMTNGAGFYVPDSNIVSTESLSDGSLLILRDFVNAIKESGLPLYILFTANNWPSVPLPKSIWRKRKTIPEDMLAENMMTWVHWLKFKENLSSDTARFSWIFDKKLVIFEFNLNSPWHIALTTQSPLRSFKCDDPQRERVLEYPDITGIVAGLEQEHCCRLSDLLEEWMPPKTIDLKSSVKSLLEASNIPRERWHDELRRLIEEITPETKPLPLPEKAPELFANRPDRRENIEEFLRRVWKPWIESGALTRPAFGKLDPQGEMALRNRLRNNALPPDLHLPTIKEVNDRALAELPPDVVRLASAAKRRRYGPENT